MRTTGRSGKVGPGFSPRRRVSARRVLAVLLFSALPVCADTPAQQFEDLATAIQTGDAAAALSRFDPAMKDFAALKRNIETLARLPQINCAIEVKNAQGASLQTVWSLQMNTQDNGPLLDRHGEALIQIGEIGGTWKIVSMAPVSILAPPDRTVFERVATLASDLSANDGGGAAAIFDSEMKGYGEIAANIDALTAQADILCAIDVIVDHEANGVHKLDVDWYMELKSRAADAPAERRRERVQLQLEKIRGRWKINALAPLDILAPIRIP